MRLNRKNVNKIFSEQGVSLPCSFTRKTDSTNELAKSFVRSGALDRGVVLAAKQTRGRGRYGRKFLSKKGKGVYMTFVYPFPEKHAEALGGICCLAVVYAVKELYGIDSSIKWPNDVTVGGKKLCGILPESVVKDEKRYALIGIGVNVNYSSADFGKLKKTAVSIRQLTGKKSGTAELAAEISKKLSSLFSQYENNYKILNREYVEKCVTVGKNIRFIKNGEIFFGKAKDVDEDCALIAEVCGKTEKIAWGEISIENQPQNR